MPEESEHAKTEAGELDLLDIRTKAMHLHHGLLSLQHDHKLPRGGRTELHEVRNGKVVHESYESTAAYIAAKVAKLKPLADEVESVAFRHWKMSGHFEVLCYFHSPNEHRCEEACAFVKRIRERVSLQERFPGKRPLPSGKSDEPAYIRDCGDFVMRWAEFFRAMRSYMGGLRYRQLKKHEKLDIWDDVWFREQCERRLAQRETLKPLMAVCLKAAQRWGIDASQLSKAAAIDPLEWRRLEFGWLNELTGRAELEVAMPRKESTEEEQAPAAAAGPAKVIVRDDIPQLIEDANYCIASCQSLRIAVETKSDALAYADDEGHFGIGDGAIHESRFRRACERARDVIRCMRDSFDRLLAYASRVGVDVLGVDAKLERVERDADYIDGVEFTVRTILVKLQAEQAKAIAPVGQEAIALLADRAAMKPALIWLKHYLDEHPDASLRVISKAGEKAGHHIPKSSINAILEREKWIGHPPRGKTAKANKAKPNDPAVMGQTLSADNIRRKF